MHGNIDEATIPVVSGDLQLRFTITDTCITKAWIDINDPQLNVQVVLSVILVQWLLTLQDGLLL